MDKQQSVKPVIKTDKKVVAWIVGGVFLPWIWVIFFLPWAVSLAVGICAGAVSLVLASQLARQVYIPKRKTDGNSISADQIAKIRAAGLHTLLERWSSISQNTHTGLQGLHNEIDNVMGQTEKAVLSIGTSFREITSKTTAQMEYAVNLLKTTRDSGAGEGEGGGNDSLTDYIRSYEALLGDMSNKLLHFSDVSLELAQGQKLAHDNARAVDSLLDEMESIAGRVSMLALNTSVVSGGVAASERAFVEMSDRIRELSQSANEFNRRIRTHIQGMKADLRQGDEGMAKMAGELKGVAKSAKTDVIELTSRMRRKNTEVTQILENINALGEEVRHDIFKIIMSLQFQDITQQRLEHLKNPLLCELSRHLCSITDETRVLNKKLQVPKAQAASADKTFRVVGAHATVDAKVEVPDAVTEMPVPETPPPARREASTHSGNDIELF